MKLFSILAMALLLGMSKFAQSSQLVTPEARSLASARYVIIGKVISTSYDPKKYIGTMEVAIVEVLKGNIEKKSLRFPVDKNPISGFGLLLNKGDVAVFFIREMKDGNAYLIAPGASAVFSQEYLK